MWSYYGVSFLKRQPKSFASVLQKLLIKFLPCRNFHLLVTAVEKFLKIEK